LQLCIYILTKVLFCPIVRTFKKHEEDSMRESFLKSVSAAAISFTMGLSPNFAQAAGAGAHGIPALQTSPAVESIHHDHRYRHGHASDFGTGLALGLLFGFGSGLIVPNDNRGLAPFVFRDHGGVLPDPRFYVPPPHPRHHICGWAPARDSFGRPLVNKFGQVEVFPVPCR
jgi:hypothetical protein